MRKNGGLDAIDKVNLRLEALKQYLTILKSLRGVTAQQLEEKIETRAKVERFLQLAIEACIDIGEIIISDLRLRAPQTSREVFDVLAEAGVLDKKFAQRFASVAGFRNILVHDYLKIDYQQVAKFINERLDDFNEFARQVAEFYL